MINPYEAPQSTPEPYVEVPRFSTDPAWALIMGLSLLALILPGALFCGSMFSVYAIHFDPSMIPKNASGPGLLGSYIFLPLTGIWIFAQLRFLFSRGKRAGKGLAIVYLICAGMMLISICEGLALWLGLIEPSPDVPAQTEESLGWYLLSFTGVLAFFLSMAYGHWRMHQLYHGVTTPT